MKLSKEAGTKTIQLPQRVPLFPLTGVVLMPYAHIPLNIFEDRYLRMVEDCFSNSHLIAMVQPTEAQADPIPNDAALYDVGTLGRVYSFLDTGEGTYQVTLQGVLRFNITDMQISPRGYRTANVNYDPYTDDLVPSQKEDGPGRTQLIELMHGYLTKREIDVDWEAVHEAPYHALISSLIMTCPFSASEKQALLESTDAHERARMLIQLFHMSLEGGTQEAGQLKH